MKIELEKVQTDAAPRAIGPYSQAIRCEDWVFVSGQIPLDPATGILVGGDFAQQVGQVLGINRDLMAPVSGAALGVRLVGRHQGGRGAVVLESGIRQDVPAGRMRTQLGVAQYQVVFALIQLAQGFRRSGGNVYGVATGLEDGLKRQSWCKLTMHQKDPSKIQSPRFPECRGRAVRLLHF